MANRNSVSTTMLVFFFFTIFIILTTTTSLMEAYSDNNSNHEMGWISTTTTRSSSSRLSRCEGSTVGDCENDEMDSEINRRILETTKYISYELLKKNSVPCSQKGASYYNCKPGAQANPYNRGCSAITKCRS
ncbi:rapid alkalinization factor-like [Papaver somniferum]|uniref:rapid alkalinization factor-like n=1 Tax=Papaver somniferum TaxID=3469 RepID=UPI000E6FD5FC|nr:rapid alkalinization factor-like [Papaver somniferum]